MPHKCIHMHIYEEFVIWSRIQAYKGDANVYGPLWTLTYICTVWTSFLIILYIFHSLFLPKRLYHSLHHRQSHDRLSPSSQHHVWLHPPIFSCLLHILLLFVRTFSPYFTCINRVGITLYSISIWVLCSLGQQFFKSWNWLHCSLQAFGLYCQWLPGLTTKSTHHYPYSYYFRTTFTFISQRILPLTPPFDIVPLDPLTPKLTMDCQQAPKFPWLCDSHASITNWVPHTSSNSNKNIFWQSSPLNIKINL